MSVASAAQSKPSAPSHSVAGSSQVMRSNVTVHGDVNNAVTFSCSPTGPTASAMVPWSAGGPSAAAFGGAIMTTQPRSPRNTCTAADLEEDGGAQAQRQAPFRVVQPSQPQPFSCSTGAPGSTPTVAHKPSAAPVRAPTSVPAPTPAPRALSSSATVAAHASPAHQPYAEQTRPGGAARARPSSSAGAAPSRMGAFTQPAHQPEDAKFGFQSVQRNPPSTGEGPAPLGSFSDGPQTSDSLVEREEGDRQQKRTRKHSARMQF